jgi:tRNA(Arg) A34 adenosine deaminase TadA
MSATAAEETLLRRAIELAAKSRAGGNPPFGSLLVDADGEILIEDHNTSVSDGDITAHPELKLARWAGRELDPTTAAKTTMYTSCQPCPMCEGAIARSGLGRVVFALSNDQLNGLKPSGPPAPVRQDGPALYEEARIPVEGYYPGPGPVCGLAAKAIEDLA